MTDYTLVIVAEDGNQYDITDYAEDIGWEENEKELAMSISFSVVMDDDNTLANIIKIGALAAVLADGTEVARGYINKAKSKKAGSGDKITCTAYDELYNLQTSEDQLYFTAGQSTKALLTQILQEWGVTIATYTGADVTHEKMAYRSGTVADAILDILDDAHKKGGVKSMLRATSGTINVIPIGGNETCYVFDEDVTISAEQEISITDLVTRVKVIGKTTAEGRPPVEATLNGLTQFGIRQKIYTRDKDATAAEAQTAAQKILDEKGKVSKTYSIQAPDVPSIRKGDTVYVTVGAMTGFYNVVGVRHDASDATITMDLKEAAQ